MTREQRLRLLAVAGVIALVAFIVLRDTGSEDEAPTTAPTVASTQAATTPAATTTAPADRPTPRRVAPPAPLLVAGRVAEIRVRKGETVRLRARSEEAEEVHVHGYDISKDVPAGGEVSMQFEASAEGIFAIEFEHSGTLIAELEVRP